MIEKAIKYFPAVFLLGFLFASLNVQAQNSFGEFFERAKAASTELEGLKTQRKYLELESGMITATNHSPKVFLSSDFLFAPYLNNNGQVVSVNPSDKAFGYDVGITNGGLYSFLINVEYPVFNRSQVQNITGQNQVEISKIDTRIETIELELEHSLAGQYFDALQKQAALSNAKENLKLLSNQLEIVKLLSRHGQYRYLDCRLLEAELIADSVNYESAEAGFRLALQQLKTTCGISDTAMAVLHDYHPALSEVQDKPSLFLKSYQNDSLAAVWQQKVFDNRYKPQVNLFANSGLNSTSLPNMGRHIGMSAGFQFTYTLFDGHQKSISDRQQMLLIEDAGRQRELKKQEVGNQMEGYRQAVESARTTLERDRKLQSEYEGLFTLYAEELKSAQISIIDYMAFLRQYSAQKLTTRLHSISLNQLINEYNYWNH